MTFTARTLLLASLALALAATPAFAAPGDLDPTFGGGDGAVVISARDGARFGSFALDGDRLVAAGDARTISEDCGGSDLALARLLGDGTPDPAFGVGGIQIEQFAGCSPLDSRGMMPPSAVVVAPDGRIFTAGRAYTPGSFNGAGWVSAHTPTGAFDTSFDGDGFVLDRGIAQGSFQALARLADGRLVAVGHHTRLASQWEGRRYLPDGSPDASFGGGDGAASFKFVPARTHETMNAAVADGDDGAMVMAGTVPGADDSPRAGDTVARMLPDGTLDASFGGGRVDLPGLAIEDLVRTSDGGFVTAGAENGAVALLKLDADGAVDETFGAAGRAAGPAGQAVAIAADSDDRLLVTGTDDDGGFVARYLVNGALDETFGDGGFVRDVPVTDVLVQPDGAVLLGGTTSDGERDAMAIVRLRGDDPEPGTDEEDGEIGGDEEPEGTDDEDGEAGDPERDVLQAGRVSIRILTAKVNRRGVLVRATWPQGTDGRARARLWTRNKGILLGRRTVRARPGTTGRTFRVRLNRRAKRMLAGGKRLRVTATLRVTGLPDGS